MNPARRERAAAVLEPSRANKAERQMVMTNRPVNVADDTLREISQETDTPDQTLRQAIDTAVKEAEAAGVSGFDIVDALRRAISDHPAARYQNEMRMRRLNAQAEASWRDPLPF
jgi:hypothetical protein